MVVEFPDRAARTWSALAEIYGQRLISNYGPEAPPLWRSKIDELSDPQLERGVRALADRDSGFCPTLGQFVAACRGDGERRSPFLPAPIRKEVDGWDGALNLMLLAKLQRACGVSRSTLDELVAHKRLVAGQLRAAYGKHTLSPQDQDDVREIETNVSRQLDAIIAMDGAPATHATTGAPQ